MIYELTNKIERRIINLLTSTSLYIQCKIYLRYIGWTKR